MTRPRLAGALSTVPRPYRRWSRFAVGLAVAIALSACATGSRSVKYPPRRPGCSLEVFTTAAPMVPVWDDIGVAEVGCHLDESEVACLHRLHAEACRMGGDILYNVPKRAARPGEREMTMRAQVAHTRPDPRKAEPKSEPEPPSTSANEPVVPIGAPAPSGVVAIDGGARDAASTD